jgi:Zn ribbon nucleic-acid-binding protein
MNKLYGDTATGKVLVCVIDAANVHRMIAENRPLEIDLNEGPWEKGLPAKLKVQIAYSETPIKDAEEFAKLLHDPHKVEDRRSPVAQSKRPHCPQCFTRIEELGVWRSEQAPVWLVFCSTCGYTFGPIPPIAGLQAKK